MSNILVVTGSARPNSVNSKIVAAVQKNLSAREGVTVTTADLVELNLPFLNAPMPPSRPEYEITDAAVKKWSDMVTTADGVVLVMPEYNHGMSALQKNAVDWLYNEWASKPVALVAYGFYAGRHAIAQFEEVNTVIKAKLDEKITGLQIGEDLGFDGSFTDEAAAQEKLSVTLDELIKSV
jgi:NAD(P)H-dependent FMN reductase